MARPRARAHLVLSVCFHRFPPFTIYHAPAAHSQRRLFESGHLLQMYQLITEEMVLEGCANSHKRFSI